MTVSSMSYSTIIANFKAALQAKSLITAIHYESTSSLVISTTITGSKVLKFQNTNGLSSGNFPIFAIGDSYTGGGTTNAISNEMIITSQESYVSSISHTLIATANYFCLIFQTAVYKYIHLFFKDNQAAPEGYVLSFQDNSSSGATHNNLSFRVSDRSPIDFVRFADVPVFNESGNILMTDLKIRGLGGFILPVTIPDIKVLAVPVSTPLGLETYGNDVAINPYYMHGINKTVTTAKILLKNGVI